MSPHGVFHVHGARLPVQTRRLWSRVLHRIVVGFHHPWPRFSRTANQLLQSKPGALRRRSSPSLFSSRTTATACTSRHGVAAPTRQPNRTRTLCTNRSSTSTRKGCDRYWEITSGGRGKAMPRQALHCQRLYPKPPSTSGGNRCRCGARHPDRRAGPVGVRDGRGPG